nr:amidohydrolase family protein [Gordonia humi]
MIVGGSLIDGRRADVRIVGDRIVAVAPDISPVDDEVIDLAGGTVLPGLHDHHVHLRAMAAAAQSVRVGPAHVRGREGLRAALRTAEPDAAGWIRGVGYYETVSGDLDRHVLDEVEPHRPVRVQHRTGAMWFVNTAGLRRLGIADHETGRLYREDRALATHTRGADPGPAEISRQLLSYGVTGVTEATPDLTDDDVAYLHRSLTDETLRQRVHLLRAPAPPRHPRLSFGPTKRIIDDDVELVEFTDWLVAQRAAGRAVAVHCVTTFQLVVTITALQTVGTVPGDRIEHAAVVPHELLTVVADLGVVVVTQPNFVAERGDEYLADVAASEHPGLWRLASLVAAGIPVAGSTDAPFGDHDPWAAMRAACTRQTPSGATLGLGERLSRRAALELFLGSPETPAVPRRVEVGATADLCLLDVSPDEVLNEFTADAVTRTVIGGT